MSLSELSPLVPMNSIRDTLSCLDSARTCCSSLSRKIVTTGVVCLCIAGTVAAASGVGYAFFEGINPVSYAAIGGGLFIGTVNCFGAVCLCLNRPKKLTDKDLQDQKESERLDKNIQNTVAENKDEVVQLIIKTESLVEKVDGITEKLKANNEHFDLSKEIERSEKSDLFLKKLQAENPDLFSNV